ncbi:MAG: DNA repair protein RecN [Prevotella sp.]|jgi:DNA repair protein RecN (Recombination protein N)|nr:DNA repair protein RecN [Prevotella sp.]
MLKHLYISNYALIDKLDVDFNAGFSVITGETGAGKSIILGAIGLLLGQRADSKSVKTGCQKCTIEAQFDISRYNLSSWFEDNDLDIEDGECTIRRELTSTGKSRGFINDTPVSVQQMKRLGEMMVDVHSQHQNLLLRQEDFQLTIVDIIANNDDLLKEYEKVFTEYNILTTEIECLKLSLAESREKEDLLRFQLNELDAAKLTDGEQEELELEQEVSTHTEEIKSALYNADHMLCDEGATLDSLKQATNALSNVSPLYSKIEPLVERLDSTLIELKDIADEVSREADNIDFNAERLEYIHERLDLIYTLQRKHHKSTVAELIEEYERLAEAISNIDNGDEAIKEKEEQREKILHNVNKLAQKLTDTRRKAAVIIEKEIKHTLEALGMPDVEFNIEIKKGELSVKGQDNISYMFSANKGMAMRPVAQVASGGEIARLMLALKALVSATVKLPTIIFDEIDTGVSGKIAEKMAEIMNDMGNAGRQVISITHLPQIAARGSYQYKVEKNSTQELTTTIMRQLNDEERVGEIAQMLSGSDITDAALKNAKELLKWK